MTRHDAYTPAHDDGDLDDQALAWVAHLMSGRADARDRAAFAAWRAATPDHEAAAREAEELWADIGATEAAARHAAPEVPVPVKRLPVRPRVLSAALAMAAALLIVIGTGMMPSPAALLADHTTAVGERRTVVLSDGTTVHLNTDTALSVEYSASERRLTLHSGEALFHVAKDSERPFLVHAGQGAARAVGTVYAVRHRQDSVDVTVSEGLVEVAAADGQRAILGAGRQAEYGAGWLTETAGPVDVAAEVAWSRGKMIFNRRPLGAVMADLERYRHGRVMVAESLRDLPVTGVFDVADSDAVLRAVEQSLPVTVRRLPLLTIIH